MNEMELLELIYSKCAQYRVFYELAHAIAVVESSLDAYALGDYEGDKPMSYGAMQCHLRGACSCLSAEAAILPEVNIDRAVKYLRECLDAFPESLFQAISAYNQGIRGARTRGWKFNSGYVRKVIGALGKLC